MTEAASEEGSLPRSAQRLDKWLWFARLAKSRTLAASFVTSGKIRVNSEKVLKASQTVKPGDVITSSTHQTIRIIRVLAPGERRGPAAEAALLYEDLTPPPPPREGPDAEPAAPLVRDAGAGRPTKRDRRQIDRLKGWS